MLNLTLIRPVTDMLVAVLSTCTKEELEDSEDEATPTSTTVSAQESAERRRIIKSKIIAVGKMSRVFALLRFVTMYACRPVFRLTKRDTGSLQNEFLSSRTFLKSPAFLMRPLIQKLRRSKRQSVGSMMRKYF